MFAPGLLRCRWFWRGLGRSELHASSLRGILIPMLRGISVLSYAVGPGGSRPEIWLLCIFEFFLYQQFGL
ncbi:hypothetical protein MPTK2_1g12170 [Marchantia polymorpha subsp. ruderalis]